MIATRRSSACWGVSERRSLAGNTRTPTRPWSDRSAPAPKRSRCASINALTWFGLSRAPARKKQRGGFQDLIRAAQLEVLTPELADLLTLLGAHPLAVASVDLGAPDTLSQRLRRQPEIVRDMRDRPPRLVMPSWRLSRVVRAGGGGFGLFGRGRVDARGSGSAWSAALSVRAPDPLYCSARLSFGGCCGALPGTAEGPPGLTSYRAASAAAMSC
jgi:hypothetical protein